MPVAIEEVRCASCGLTFTAPCKARRKFCSRRCANGVNPSRRPLLAEKLCPGCGQMFHPHWRGTIYCSKACRPRRPTVACSYCGTTFKQQRSEIRHCSVRCRNLAQRRRVETACLQCGEPFEYVRSRPTTFCSRRCWALSRGHRPAGASAVGMTRLRGGYRWVRTEAGWRAEHRVVMEGVLGRPLHRGESVHHKNGNKLDNRSDNLELWLRSQPTGIRAAEALPHCATCTCA